MLELSLAEVEESGEKQCGAGDHPARNDGLQTPRSALSKRLHASTPSEFLSARNSLKMTELLHYDLLSWTLPFNPNTVENS